VLLEQGVGFAFTYNGLPVEAVGLLAGGLMARTFPPPAFAVWVQQLKAAAPMDRDRQLRLLFMKIYERIRWYDPGLDDTNPAVQQIPMIAAIPGSGLIDVLEQL